MSATSQHLIRSAVRHLRSTIDELDELRLRPSGADQFDRVTEAINAIDDSIRLLKSVGIRLHGTLSAADRRRVPPPQEFDFEAKGKTG